MRRLRHWLRVLLGREFKTPCPGCGSHLMCLGPTGGDRRDPLYTWYCGNCGKYRAGHKHDGVFR